MTIFAKPVAIVPLLLIALAAGIAATISGVLALQVVGAVLIFGTLLSPIAIGFRSRPALSPTTATGHAQSTEGLPTESDLPATREFGFAQFSEAEMKILSDAVRRVSDLEHVTRSTEQVLDRAERLTSQLAADRQLAQQIQADLAATKQIPEAAIQRLEADAEPVADRDVKGLDRLFRSYAFQIARSVIARSGAVPASHAQDEGMPNSATQDTGRTPGGQRTK